jgi:photosynthetic reaction center cytochrome c subunit
MLLVARTSSRKHTRIILSCLSLAATCLLSNRPAEGQASQQPKPVMVEDIFKDVRLLKAISVNEFMATMGFFSASLGTSCTHCHVDESGGNWAKYADDTANKEKARGMIAMVSAINKSYFGGRRVLTCYSCHRGGERPLVTPSLAELYSTPPTPEPDQLLPSGPNTKSADQILDKYIQALGGPQRLDALVSFVAKGVFQGYGSPQKSPVEIFFKAPNQRAMIVHTSEGDSASTFDGRAGWVAAPATDRPVTLTALSGGDLDGARLDAELSSPARIKQALREWRVGVPTSIDDREVDVVQGTSDGRYPVNLYFDSQTGLLVRLVRYADSPVGLSPTQIDYADYREMAGIKMPFRWTVTWLDGRSMIQLSEVRPNVPIDAATFSRPAPSAPHRQ